MWRPLGICVLTVALGACSGSGSTQASGTVGTLPPATTVAPTTAVTIAVTVVAPSTTADLGPGPTDEEIQQILDDADAKVGAIFAAFKPGLVITPAIDKLIVEAFGPVAQEVRDALRSHQADGGAEIRESPRAATTTVRRVVAKSSLCVVVDVNLDASAMLTAEARQATLFLRRIGDPWYVMGELTQQQAAIFEGRPCYVE